MKQKLKRHSITCTDAEWKALQERADSLSISVCQLVRILVRKELDAPTVDVLGVK